MTRQFKLINNLGASFDLMRRDALFYTPDGLGFRFDQEYFRIGNSYQLIDTESAQKVIAGVMVFASYQVYEEFVDFITHTPLKLAYMPLNEFAYLDCEVTRLDKAEIDYRDRKLKCNIDFTGSSKWYIPRQVLRTSPVVTNGKVYTYNFDYTYADSANSTINITNDSTEDSPCIITIFGPITNPTWSLIVNNQTVQSGAVLGTIGNGNNLRINSNDNDLTLAEFDAMGNLVSNKYPESDFTRENFIYVPPGRSTLFISGTTSDGVNAWIEVREIHETI